MTYEYKGLIMKFFFIHDQRPHPRLEETREATTLVITSSSGLIVMQQTFWHNPEKDLPSKEFRRKCVIGKFKTILPRGEYICLRKAYFGRPRKTRAQRHESKLFGRHLRGIMADGDAPKAVRAAATLLQRMILTAGKEIHEAQKLSV